MKLWDAESRLSSTWQKDEIPSISMRIILPSVITGLPEYIRRLRATQCCVQPTGACTMDGLPHAG